MCILAPLCSSFLHSTELALTLYGHYCPSQLLSAIFRQFQTLLLVFRFIGAHTSPILLFVCIPQILCLLFRVISVHHRSIMLFFALQRRCSHPLESFVRIPPPFCSFFVIYRPCSCSVWSLVLIPALFCSFYAFHRYCSYPLKCCFRHWIQSVNPQFFVTLYYNGSPYI